MKKLILSVLSLAAVATLNSANAQINGITIGPYGATPDQDITITVDADLTCNNPAVENLAGTTQVRLHSGFGPTSASVDLVNLSHTNAWQGVVPMDDPNALFTLQPNGKWQKTINASTYYNNTTGEEIKWLCFVINGGPAGSEWSKKASNTKPSNNECSGDFFIEFPITGQITSANDAVKAGKIALSAYPNPVRSNGTTISYGVNSADKVTLKVYDILGTEVATLVNGSQPTGIQSVKWDAAGVPAGVYFYTLKIGNKVETKKIVVAG